jgi:hypothetical protein
MKTSDAPKSRLAVASRYSGASDSTGATDLRKGGLRVFENEGEIVAKRSRFTPLSNQPALINRHTGERLQLRRVPLDGEMCLELKRTLPTNQDGPPLHIHFKESEGGTVMAGTLAAEVDGVEVRIEQGGPCHCRWAPRIAGGTAALRHFSLMASQGPSSIWTASFRRHST